MRSIIIFLSIFLFSCSNSLDKTYNFSNWEQDKIELKKYLGKDGQLVGEQWINDFDFLSRTISSFRRPGFDEDMIEYMEYPYIGLTYREMLRKLKKDVYPYIEKKQENYKEK